MMSPTLFFKRLQVYLCNQSVSYWSSDLVISAVKTIGCDALTVRSGSIILLEDDMKVEKPRGVSPFKFHLSPVVVIDSQVIPNGISPQVGPSPNPCEGACSS